MEDVLRATASKTWVEIVEASQHVKQGRLVNTRADVEGKVCAKIMRSSNFKVQVGVVVVHQLVALA